MSLAARDYDQYPQPFELPDEVVTPTARFSGTRARVYHLMRITQDRNYSHPIGRQMGPPGWTPAFLLREPWSGGCEGKKRARELREWGCEITIVKFDVGDSTTTLYRIERDGLAEGLPTAQTAATAPQAGPRRADLAKLDVMLCQSFAQTQGAGREVVEVRFGYPVGIAPSSALVAQVERGQIEPAQAESRYLQELRDSWRGGRLCRNAAQWFGRPVAWVVPPVAGRWSPLPALRHAIEALGATVTVEG